MPDREKTIKDIEECLSASCRGFRPRKLCPYNDEEWDIMRDALALLKEQEAAYQGAVELLRQKTILFDDAIKRLKEQDDMGKELTDAVELIHKKNERIKKLEEQIETLTKWRANAGAFD